jgi:hypothetical protein
MRNFAAVILVSLKVDRNRRETRECLDTLILQGGSELTGEGAFTCDNGSPVLVAGCVVRPG